MRALGLLLLLTACSCYHMGTGSLTQSYQSIAIPYAQGDNQGLFTQALIQKMASQSGLRYVNDEADLRLKVCLSAPSSQNIGYIYSPKNPKVTTANEGRLTQSATVTVIDCAKGCTVLGPFKVTASIDFDFESDLGTINRHAFALGQLEMNNLAKDAATPSLYHLLAEKIVDYVNNSW